MLSVPERHQLRIARDTLKMTDWAVDIMGGPNKQQARDIIEQATGKRPCEECDEHNVAPGLRVCNICAAAMRRSSK